MGGMSLLEALKTGAALELAVALVFGGLGVGGGGGDGGSGGGGSVRSFSFGDGIYYSKT